MIMHKSVLLEEIINSLNIKDNGIYVDATLGYGGHSGEILKRLKKGKLFAFDQDDYAINYSKEKFKDNNNIVIIKSNFSNLKNELNKLNIDKIDGIIFDLGVSSVQLDKADRGFSFHNDARLDMRMDRSNKLDAHYVVNNYDKDTLCDIFRKYGEEKYAYSIACKIVEYRKNKEIDTTLELVDIIKSAIPYKAMRDVHPARRVFQAIRIEVNNELVVLEKALEDAISMLNKDGIIAVITFHSLEDKIVKNIFRKYSQIDNEIKKLPEIPYEFLPTLEIVKSKITPSIKELEENNRARSSKLRVAKKIKG